MRSPARGKGHEVKGPTGKGESGLKGASLDLLVHLPQNQSLCDSVSYIYLYV